MEDHLPPKPNSETDDITESTEEGVMSLWDHLAELRQVLIKSSIAILVLFVLSMSFSEQLLFVLKIPLMKALPADQASLHFTGPLDVFLASLKVSFLASITLSCPYWLYQFWTFIRPGLHEHEKKLVWPFLVASVSLFFLGLAFAYFIMLPITLQALITWGQKVALPIITINDYISLVVMLLLAFGLCFETPIILILLGRLDLITAKALKDFRPFFLVTVLVVAAILTPPDPLSQIGLAIPLYLMYEMSILIISFTEKRAQP